MVVAMVEEEAGVAVVLVRLAKISRPTEGFERERRSLGCLFFKQRRAAEAVEGRAREEAWREAFSR